MPSASDLGNAAQFLKYVVPFGGIFFIDVAQKVQYHAFFGIFGSLVEQFGVVLHGNAFVQKQCGVAAVVNNQLRAFASGEGESLQCAPPVFFDTLAFPSEHGHSRGGDGCGGMVLSGEDVTAGPTDVGAELAQCLDKHCSLYCHVQGACNAGALERFLCTVFLTASHQAWHLLFGGVQFFATPVLEVDIGNFVFVCHDIRYIICSCLISLVLKRLSRKRGKAGEGSSPCFCIRDETAHRCRTGARVSQQSPQGCGRD